MRYFSTAGRVTAVVGVLMVAGCAWVGPGTGQAPAPIGASTAPVGGECAAQGAQWAVGRSATAKVVEEARVRAGARMARVLRPGQAVTLEFDGQRLNLEMDGSGKVIGARCG